MDLNLNFTTIVSSAITASINAIAVYVAITGLKSANHVFRRKPRKGK